MAGKGSRFSDAGYTFPKPLILVHDKPMIQVVVENLKFDADYVFIVQKEHYEKYKLEHTLKLIVPDCKIVVSDGVTEGAACTTLLAKEYINNDQPLIIANSDQFIEYSRDEFLKYIDSSDDGTILTFESTHPKWSFAEVDQHGLVVRVAEKDPISKDATVGIYCWSKGSDYIKYAEQMISENFRVNGEFYVAPIYNFAIKDGKQINIFPVKKMFGLGIPEDLNYFLNHYRGVI